MANPSDKSQIIINILKQEKKNGCNNSVVIGGIDEFITEQIELIPPKFHLKTPYSLLDVQERLNWISSLIMFYETPKEKRSKPII